MKIIVIILIILFSGKLFGQADTSSVNPNKLIDNPKFFGIQIEVVTAIAINEVGISGDFDFYSSTNNKYNLGLRFSTEYYKIMDLDVGGGSTYGPYWDFSILGRYSVRGNFIWFSPLLGISLHNNLEENNTDSNLLLKWGFEFKFNLYQENVGLLLKLVSGFAEKSGYGGIGISISFYKN